MRKYLILLLLIFVQVTHAYAGARAKDLEGEWQIGSIPKWALNNGYGREGTIFIFLNYGTLKWGNSTGEYEVVDRNAIKVKIPGYGLIGSFEYTIKGTKLILKYLGEDEPIILNKYDKSFEYVDEAEKLADEGKYNEALKELEKASKINKNNCFIYNGYGYVYYKKNDYLQALNYFKKAVSCDNNESKFHNNTGMSYYYMDDHEKAIESFTKSIALNSENYAAYAYRGYSYFQTGDYESSKNDYNVACKNGNKVSCNNLKNEVFSNYFVLTVTSAKTSKTTKIKSILKQKIQIADNDFFRVVDYTEKFKEFGPAIRIEETVGGINKSFVVLQNYPNFDKERKGKYIYEFSGVSKK